MALLVFIGWSVAGPISRLISGELGNDSSAVSDVQSDISQEISSGFTEASSAPVSSNLNSSQAVSSEDVTVKPERVEYSSGLSVYLPLSVISDSAKLDAFIENAKAQDVKNVIIELKDSTGYLYYKSSVREAKKCEAVSSKAVGNISSVILKLKENGIAVTAKIHCFSDRIATDIAGAAVRYRGETGSVWLDGYKEEGGKSWLSPYSQVARDYLKNIASELGNLGVDNILLASVRFPGGYQKDAYYGGKSETQSRTDCLKEFVTEMKNHLSSSGVQVWLDVSDEYYINSDAEIYGTNPFTFGVEHIFVNLVAEDFGKSAFINNTAISDPYKNYNELISAVISASQSLNEDGAELIVMLQGYGYSANDIKKQISSTKRYAVTKYALKVTDENVPAVK